MDTERDEYGGLLEVHHAPVLPMNQKAETSSIMS